MLVELGNHSAVRAGIDDAPKVTSIHIPEFDAEFLEHTDHYGHHQEEFVSSAALKSHLYDANAAVGPDQWPVTNLPGHETLLSIEAAIRERAQGRPEWINVTAHPTLTREGRAPQVERFLSDFYEVPTLAEHYACDLDEAHARKQLDYFTMQGPPGEYLSEKLPDLRATYMQDGRIMNNLNDGGDTLAATMNGTGTAATATTITTGQTLVTNALAGKRIYVFTTSGNVFVWGNVISNNNAASASVITVDQWYVPLTPGGSAGATPGTPWSWVAVDGGMVSSWFAALATGANAPVNTDHTLATNGNVEYTQAGGTLIRKICPTATDVSSSARTVTLVPVFTANSSDVPNLPKVFTTIGFFASMVVSFGGAGGPMKFETAMNASATVAALNDQVTVTETITGS